MTDLLRPVGADISKKTIDLELFTEATSPRKRGKRLKISNDAEGFAQFDAWVQSLGGARLHLCLEATGTYSDAFALFLFEHSHQVSLINPARVTAFRKSEGITTKTDAHDAWLLARFCAQKRPSLWHPTPPQIQQLQILLSRRDDLDALVRQEHNRLENHRLDAQTRTEILAHLTFLQQQIEQVNARLTAHVQADEEMQQTCDRLDTIPGIASLTAMRLLSVYHDLQQFPSAKQVVAYAGVCSTEHTSGTSVRGARSISMQGNAQVRHWLYMCALSAMRWDPDMKHWSTELKARGKCSKVVIVAVMRKLLHLMHGVLKSKSPYDPARAWPSHYPAPGATGKGDLCAA